jgi:hypothetical protein
MLPSEFGSGSTGHRRFQHWVKLYTFKMIWTKYWKNMAAKKEASN